jgi:hypothetical protein
VILHIKYTGRRANVFNVYAHAHPQWFFYELYEGGAGSEGFFDLLMPVMQSVTAAPGTPQAAMATALLPALTALVDGNADESARGEGSAVAAPHPTPVLRKALEHPMDDSQRRCRAVE